MLALTEPEDDVPADTITCPCVLLADHLGNFVVVEAEVPEEDWADCWEALNTNTVPLVTYHLELTIPTPKPRPLAVTLPDVLTDEHPQALIIKSIGTQKPERN